MEKQKLEWLPENPKVIGITILSEMGEYISGEELKHGIFPSWVDAIAFIAEGYGYETDAFIAYAVNEVGEKVGMTAKRVWGQWFKKEPRKLISWMRFNNLIRVLWIE
jgi:hypothetical protein